MDIRQLHSQLSGITAPLHTRSRWRLLSYAVLLLLAALGVGLAFTLGTFAPPPMVYSSTAQETQPSSRTPVMATSRSSSEPLLMLKAGEIPLLRSLQERQEQLAERTKQLDQREETLRQVQQQIEEKLATLTLLRKEVGALLEEKTAFETKRFEHLVKVYEGMKPEEAAALVERLDQDTAVHLLAQMKGKKVSPILGALKPDVAVQLSERLAIQQQAQKATAKETP